MQPNTGDANLFCLDKHGEEVDYSKSISGRCSTIAHSEKILIIVAINTISKTSTLNLTWSTRSNLISTIYGRGEVKQLGLALISTAWTMSK